MIIFHLILILIFSFLLIKASDILLINLTSVARKTRVGQFAITGFLMALATSLPELFVGVAAALGGRPSLSLGNIIGSNIANLSLVIGGAALLAGTVTVRGKFLRQDVFVAFLAGAAPMILLVDKTLSRVDGLILLAIYGFYQFGIFNAKKQKVLISGEEKESFSHRLLNRLNRKDTKKELRWIFLGVALLLFSADMIVRSAVEVAAFFNLPLLLVGLFLVAIGTSLPELAFSLQAIRKHQPTMAFGNLLGSIVANGTLIIGVTALIAPIRIQAFGEYLLATMAFVLIFGGFYYFIRTKHRLDRWEGAFLIGFYLAFVFSAFIHP